MRSRREQLQAYRFVSRRITSAVLSGDPETNELPMRRLGLSTFASVMVGAIVVAGFGLYGQIRPGGNTAWKSEKVLIIEKETGVKYVYRAKRLYPVLNYASGLLITRQPDPQVVHVSRNSLADVPRGRPYGIAYAPDSLPDPGHLVQEPWSVCNTTPPADQPGIETATAVLVGGIRFPGGTPVADKGILVKKGEDKVLLWNHKQFPIRDDVAYAAVAGSAPVPPVKVRAAFLNAVPVGGRLGRITPSDVPGSGQPAPQHLPGKVGDVYEFDGKRYILLPDGLSQVGELTYKLLAGAGQVRKLTAGEFQRGGVSKTAFRAELPATAPPLETNPPRALCVTYEGRRDGQDVSTLRAYDEQPAELDPEAGTVVRHDKNEPDVDRMILHGGTGALLRSTTMPTTYLLTDQARRYPLANDTAKDALGYHATTPTELPSALLALLPRGPELNPDDPDVAGAGGGAGSG